MKVNINKDFEQIPNVELVVCQDKNPVETRNFASLQGFWYATNR